jgi:hypothetical protein
LAGLRLLGSLRIELLDVPRAEAKAVRDALRDADLVLHIVEDAPPADERQRLDVALRMRSA